VATRIKIAKTTDELDALFRCRHVALVSELGSQFPHPDGRLMDRFDAFPSTWNVVAVERERVVGDIRLCPVGTGGSPLDGLYDFSSNLPKGAEPAP
jgi:N-acyl-L-homoserine lactone synthetase